MICPGCSLDLTPEAGLPDPIFHSSPECWALYGELAAQTQVLGDPAFPHQHAVDAYTAQHIGGRMSPIAAVFALLGLCMALEHGSTGREVQLAHMKLGKKKRDWPRLVPAARAFAITVRDVLQERADLSGWMECTWRAWRHEQERIRALVRTEALSSRSG